MLIKIDTRETELFKKCEGFITSTPKFKDLKIISETLPLGDIIINDGTNDCVIIERKTLADLAASIKDGRYEEQSYRLNGIQHHNHNIIYLIEGDITRFNTFKERIDKQTLYSAMFSINYFKGFSVMRTNTLEETAYIICNMTLKLYNGIKNGKKGFYSNFIQNITNNTETNNTETNNTDTENKETNNTEMNKTDTKNKETNNSEMNKTDTENKEKDYCTVVKKVKKENITQANIGEIMLCQIPTVSSTTALAVLAQFKTLPNLIKAIQESENSLNNIYTTDSNGKKRKIGKNAIENIIKFLKE